MLKYDGDTYDVVGFSYEDAPPHRTFFRLRSIGHVWRVRTDSCRAECGSRTSSANSLYANAVISWEIITQEARCIEANLRLRLPDSNFATTTNQELGIQGMADVLIYENCSHNSRMTLRDNTFSAIVPPWYDVGTETPDMTSFVRVVAVDGAHALRYFALASHQAPAVLRRHVCLSCYLVLCRENNISVLFCECVRF
jgi:hypothetical protein